MIKRAPEDLAGDLVFLLTRAAEALERELAAGLAAVGSSVRAQCVLSAALTGDFTQIELVELCALDKTTMVVTLDQLEAAGLAERRPSATDRRARIVGVTKAGQRSVAEGKKIIARVYEDVLGTLPARERKGLTDGLLRLVQGRLAAPTLAARAERSARTIVPK